MKTKRNIHLDVVRVISIFCIIFFHYNIATVRIVSADLVLLEQFKHIGPIGVSMFFILSGASLALSSNSHFSSLTFYKKRFLAIYPLFWSIYILTIFTNTIILQPNYFTGRPPLTFGLTILGLDGFLYYKIPNYYILGEWFLGCILILYAIYPAIRYLFKKNKHLSLITAFIFCFGLEYFYTLDMYILRFPFFRLFEFIFGMYLITFFAILKQHKLKLGLISIAGIVSIFAMRAECNIFISYSILGALFFTVLASASISLKRILPAHFIIFLSSYSFTAFLIHHVFLKKVLFYFKNSSFILDHRYLLFFITLFCIYLLAYIVHSSLRYLFRHKIEVL